MEAWIFGLRVKGIYKIFSKKKLRLYVMCGLSFFVVALFFSCSKNEENNKITILWKDKRAIGISLTGKFVTAISPDSIVKLLEVRLLTSEKSVSILGEYQTENNQIIFTPLIPFTRGLHYEVCLRGQRLDSFDIPPADSGDAPALLKIFPSRDSLPENLLKVYLHFSHPMREGQSGQYVVLVKNNIDTIKGAFLDLQPELWNEDRTVLTLWLDPGRIKRDLQPNKLLGAPLQKNAGYQLLVLAPWQDKLGGSLPKTYTKSFVTTGRDSLSPNPLNWKIGAPKSGTIQTLNIDFGEQLDYSLLNETLTIQTADDITIPGKWEIGKDEKNCRFIPNKIWLTGHYKLHIETRLEDLAGNNLNRPFDRDVTRKETKIHAGDFVDIPFQIKD